MQQPLDTMQNRGKPLEFTRGVTVRRKGARFEHDGREVPIEPGNAALSLKPGLIRMTDCPWNDMEMNDFHFLLSRIEHNHSRGWDF